MEFLKRNYFDTSTQLVVTSNTVTADFLLDPDPRRQYVSDGYNNDSLTSSLTINFDQTQTVDRIILMSHNLKALNIFYNGATANAFVLTGVTATSQLTNLTGSNHYFRCTSVACTSITFDMKSTQIANSEKAVGYIFASQQELDFDRNPDAGGFTPVLKPKELKHELSTGSIRVHTVANRWDVKIKFKYISTSFRDSLKAVWDQNDSKVFVPFGTITSWDGFAFECTWNGPFEFYKFSDNNAGAGFSGNIQLNQT